MTRLKPLTLLITLAILILISTGCSSISKTEAEARAVSFVKQNVKFYAKENNSNSSFDRYAISSLSSYKNGASWVVLMHISAGTANATKQNDLILRVDDAGEVFEFNGQRVPRT